MLSSSASFNIPAVISLIRVRHWVKNLFIFLPIFFAGQLLNDFAPVLELLIAFFAFSFTASSIYIINDIQDVEADKKHPVKKTRPLASGELTVPVAIGIMSFLLIFAAICAYFIGVGFMVILGFYFLLNLAYSNGLKNVSLLDLFIVASGFLLRTIAGGVVADIPVSKWLMIMVFLLALFLALAKRRDDIVIKLTSGNDMRKSVKNYNLEYLGACLTMIAGVIIVAYIMYTISEEVITRLDSDLVYVTSIFVIAGLMRYLQITLVENNSGSPTKVLYQDTFIRATIISWIISFYIIIYIPH